MKRRVLDRLGEALGEGVQRDVPLAPYTSMRVGGPADLLIPCATADEVVRAVRLAIEHDVPWRVLGGGCNVLVADEGVRGLVVLNRAERVQFEGEGTVWAETGILLAQLARETVARGLAGLAWAAGLPGTLGGAIAGNAGAFGGEIADVLQSGRVLDPHGEVTERARDWFAFTYRGSRVKSQRPAARCVVLDARLQLQPGDREALQARVAEILDWRRTRHPAGATMGSTFKNAPDAHAGRLIEGLGLKGYSIGGAQVSEKHANFFMNANGATAADVLTLIRYVQQEAERRLGIRLEPEVELVGEWE